MDPSVCDYDKNNINIDEILKKKKSDHYLAWLVVDPSRPQFGRHVAHWRCREKVTASDCEAQLESITFFLVAGGSHTKS